MHIHILGICGTFMGGIALLARALGHEVSGSDANVYPPMSTQLAAAGIEIRQGYAPEHLQPAPDWVVVGNAMTRGNPAVEYMLDADLPYISGPQWLAEHVLRGRWVLAVAGTHGKTTTSSLLAWILDQAGLSAGFLIGGVPENFGVSARLGDSNFFVVEADEYDTAFFDKRSKFVHYRPRTLIINNIEFDHADIFADLAMIQRQFHHLLRILPASGRLVAPSGETAVEQVLQQGLWTPLETFSLHGPADWRGEAVRSDGSRFRVWHEGREVGEVVWDLLGRHNMANALAALAAAHHVGIAPEQGLEALAGFRNVKRRLELRGEVKGIRVYDDFAHHPTAIRTTLDGLRQRVGTARILAVLEPRSNTMRLGVHADQLAASLDGADQIFFYAPENLQWDPKPMIRELDGRALALDSVEKIIRRLTSLAQAGDHILVMSNGGFEGLHQRLLDALMQG